MIFLKFFYEVRSKGFDFETFFYKSFFVLESATKKSWRQRPKTVPKLLKMGQSASTQHGFTEHSLGGLTRFEAFNRCAETGNIKGLEALRQNGLDINSSTPSGETG